MNDSDKPEVKPSETDSTAPISEEQLQQAVGGVTKGQVTYLKYELRDVKVSSVNQSSDNSK